jgi:hypothetical protein
MFHRLREGCQAALRGQIENAQGGCRAKPFFPGRIHSFAIIRSSIGNGPAFREMAN